MLDPSDAHILVGDTIQFKIKQLKRGKLEEVSAHQYYLEIADNKYATLEGNHATGHTIGNTTVYLRDRNIPNDNDMAPMPTATLSITDAKQLSLNLLPHYNWVTMVGERHEIAVDLLSRYVCLFIWDFGFVFFLQSFGKKKHFFSVMATKLHSDPNLTLRHHSTKQFSIH